MDPFGDGAPEGGDDLSNFQPPADASALNGDFYGSEQPPQASFDYAAAEASFMQEVSDGPAPVDLPAPAMAIPDYGAPAMPDYNAGAGIPMVEEENELTKFMTKLQEEVATKAVEQEKVGVACREKAQSEMTQFLDERARAKQAKQASNRVTEQATMEKLAADLEAENPWERVVSLVDLETNRKQKLAALNKKDAAPANGNKEPETVMPKEEEEDVSRMRQLFVQLKATPLEKTRTESVAAH